LNRSWQGSGWPLFITLATTFFSFTGLAFGESCESGAERAAGAMLVALAALFAIEKLIY
jgi:uncharacterized membrane protein YccC